MISRRVFHSVYLEVVAAADMLDKPFSSHLTLLLLSNITQGIEGKGFNRVTLLKAIPKAGRSFFNWCNRTKKVQ